MTGRYCLRPGLIARTLLVVALAVDPMSLLRALLPARQASERARKLVAQMTLDEKLGLVAGMAGIQYVKQMPPAPPEARGGDGFVPGIPRLGVPDLQLIGAGLGITDMTMTRPMNNRQRFLPRWRWHRVLMRRCPTNLAQ